MRPVMGALAPLKDVRDYLIKTSQQEFPKEYKVKYLPEVKDQGGVCSCVAHATATILEALDYQENGQRIKLSTDFIYGLQNIAYNKLDPGMYLRDACRIVKDYGDCSYDRVSTNTEQPDVAEVLRQQPWDDLFEEASAYKVKSYARCDRESAMKYAIMKYGPVLASVNWHNENYIDSDNVIHMDESSDYGRHAIVVYGWNEHGWLCRNSWGKGFGRDGNFIYPYTSKFNEAWSFVDADNDDVKKTKHTSSLWDFIYRLINTVLNWFQKK